MKSDAKRLRKQTYCRVDPRIEPKRLALMTGEELCHGAPPPRIDPQNPFVGTNMLHSRLTMAAIPASQRRVNGNTISGTQRFDLRARLHHSAGHLVPHHHAWFAPAAFAG